MRITRMKIFAEMARSFGPQNIKLLNSLIKDAYESLLANENNREATLFHASLAYSLADFVRQRSGVNICTLEFAVLEPPYPEDHPLIRSLNVLDPLLTEMVQVLARSKEGANDPEDLARFLMGAIWKGYLLTLSIPPSQWGPEDYHVLESLRILSTISGKDVLAMLRGTRNNPTQAETIEDWPPPGFWRIWSGNQERINANTRWGEYSGNSLPVNEFAGLREAYNPNNIRQLNGLLELTERRLQQFRIHEGFLKLYAAAAFEIAIEIKRKTGVNICTLSFPMEKPPLAPTHPMMVSLACLDAIISSRFNELAGETQVRVEQFDTLSKMEMGLVWKGYVLTLNTPPENWFSYNYASIGSLKILSKVSGADAIEEIEERGFISVNGVDPKDWPPPGFLKVYFVNRERLDSREK